MCLSFRRQVELKQKRVALFGPVIFIDAQWKLRYQCVTVGCVCMYRDVLLLCLRVLESMKADASPTYLNRNLYFPCSSSASGVNQCLHLKRVAAFGMHFIVESTHICIHCNSLQHNEVKKKKKKLKAKAEETSPRGGLEYAEVRCCSVYSYANLSSRRSPHIKWILCTRLLNNELSPSSCFLFCFKFPYDVYRFICGLCTIHCILFLASAATKSTSADGLLRFQLGSLTHPSVQPPIYGVLIGLNFPRIP